MSRKHRDLVLAGSVACFALGLGGCGDSASGGNGAPNDIAGEQDPEPSPSTSPKIETRQLCDGSSDVRFVFTGVGGYVDHGAVFFSPFGNRFVVIDGGCNYAVSLAEDLGEIREGHLDAERARQIEASLSYSELDALQGIYDDNCIDGEYRLLSTPWARVACGCDCFEGPPALYSAERAAIDLIHELFEAGTPSTGALGILLAEEWHESSPPPLSWPLPWDPSSRLFVYQREFDHSIDPAFGFAVEDAAERATVRAVREQWRAQPISYGGLPPWVQMHGGSLGTTPFRLYLRDEPPAHVVAALEALLATRP